jgi:aquaporin Z
MGLLVGLTLTLVHLVGIPLTGTSVNPARAFGPAVIVGGSALNQVWLFMLAPMLGGAVAAWLHGLVNGQEEGSVFPQLPSQRAHADASETAHQQSSRP